VPILDKPVDTIDTAAVLSILQPVWNRIPETASRLRGRVEAVLDYAKAHGLRSGENPAAWRNHLALVLPQRQKLSRGHHAALSYAEVPAFIAELRERETIPALALEFLILTAARAGEVLGATWDEIDFGAQVWTIPASRMKAGLLHRVPLSARAMEIVERMAEIRTGDLVFAGQRRRRPLAGTTLAALVPGATVHGFRSAFRDWAGGNKLPARDRRAGAGARDWRCGRTGLQARRCAGKAARSYAGMVGILRAWRHRESRSVPSCAIDFTNHADRPTGRKQGMHRLVSACPFDASGCTQCPFLYQVLMIMTGRPSLWSRWT
jgi:integrase